MNFSCVVQYYIPYKGTIFHSGSFTDVLFNVWERRLYRMNALFVQIFTQPPAMALQNRYDVTDIMEKKELRNELA